MTLALYGKSRRRKGALLAAALLAVLIATIGALGAITSAFAHEATISGTAKCEADGTWKVDWTITGDTPSKRMHIASFTVTAGTTTSPTPNPVSAGTNPQTARATTSGISLSTGSVTATAQVYWDDNNGNNRYPAQGYQTKTQTVNKPDCGTIIIKKVVAGQGASATDTFTAAVNNEDGPEGDKTGISFSQSSPYTHTFGGHRSGDDFVVTETNRPGNYQLVATWEGNGDASCPQVGANTWDSNNPQNGEDISNLGSGTKTVCFLNVKVTAKTCTDLGLALIDKFNFNNNSYQWESGSGTTGQQVTITSGSSTSGNWTSTVPIGAVIVKGGSGPVAYKVFPFPPPYPADTMSGSFDNTGLINWGGNTPAVSHVEFCEGTSTTKTIDLQGGRRQRRRHRPQRHIQLRRPLRQWRRRHLQRSPRRRPDRLRAEPGHQRHRRH